MQTEQCETTMTYDKVRERRLIESHLRHSTSVPLSYRLGCVVAAPHADSLSQDLLQLGRGAACDHSPYQSQRVVVEIRLYRYTVHQCIVYTQRRAIYSHHTHTHNVLTAVFFPDKPRLASCRLIFLRHLLSWQLAQAQTLHIVRG